MTGIPFLMMTKVFQRLREVLAKCSAKSMKMFRKWGAVLRPTALSGLTPTTSSSHVSSQSQTLTTTIGVGTHGAVVVGHLVVVLALVYVVVSCRR
jgi:hypothetical protein